MDVISRIHHTLITTGTCSSDTVMLRLTLIGIFCYYFSSSIHGCFRPIPRWLKPTPTPFPKGAHNKLTETVLFARDGLDYQDNYQDYQHNQRFQCVNRSRPCLEHGDCNDCIIGGIDCYSGVGRFDWSLTRVLGTGSKLSNFFNFVNFVLVWPSLVGGWGKF